MHHLFPASVAPYVKTLVSLIGVIACAIVAAVDDAPKWLAVPGAVVASVAFYLGRNQPPEYLDAGDGSPSATSPPDGGR